MHSLIQSIKAVFAGGLFIVVTILLMQLAYIFIAVGYNALAKTWPYLNEITGLFRYLVGIPGLMLIMFAGGYITAAVARTNVVLHCLFVGLLTSGGLLLLAMENAGITITGIVVLVLTLGATVVGGVFWQRGRDDTASNTALSR